MKFSCKVRGKPLPELSWICAEKAFGEDDNTTISYKQQPDKLEVESSLTLKNIAITDESDLYSIQAENIIGGTSHPFSLLVNQLPEIIKAPAAVELVEGESASLTVVATGKPAPELTWHKDNKLIKDGDVAAISTSEGNNETSSTLSARSVHIDHDGKYKVTAANSVGTVKAEFPLTGTYFFTYKLIYISTIEEEH